MKKLLLGIGIIVLLGAGCAPSGKPANAPKQEPGQQSSSAATGGARQPLPEIKAPKTPIDVSGWQKFVTKAGIVVNYPTGGGYSPTWTYQVLAAGDSRLQGACYVASGVAYERTPVPGYDDACQTATTIDGSAAGARTDYFAFRKDGRINLITFTKKYPAGFDMDEYAATLDRIIKNLD